ncbi:MAG: 4'-phosphopantetheinyl transferase superfamily protein, partial [Rhodobacteraceae bacterium]|nr:4'-phosphopantetheinyl transferase superfamily protein [Paracoccaceae bacterium]
SEMCIRDSSQGFAVLAVSTSGPVGIDVELPTRRIDPLALAGTVFVQAERAVIESLSEDRRLQRFLAFWTAKEARMKLTGQGMELAPKSIVLALADGEAVGYAAPARPAARLAYADAGRPGAVCAVAVLAGDGRP